MPAGRAPLPALCLLVVALAAAAPGRRSWKPLFSTAPAPGVWAWHLPGLVDLGRRGREAVVLHVFLRAVRDGGVVRLRGFAFAESAEREWFNWRGVVASQPPLLREWLPRIFLRRGPAARPGAGL